jgi:hypothetical protein
MMKCDGNQKNKSEAIVEKQSTLKSYMRLLSLIAYSKNFAKQKFARAVELAAVYVLGLAKSSFLDANL